MNFTKEEIKIAKQTRDVIISEDVEELKAVYMAGEICMWNEIQQEKVNDVEKSENNCNLDIVSKRSELLAYHEWHLKNRRLVIDSRPEVMVDMYISQ